MQLPRGAMLPALLAAAGAASAAAGQAGLNPLGEVLQLLDSLTAKIEKEGKASDAAYKEYVDWCKDASAQKTYEIKTATTQTETLEAAIAKASADAAASATKIEELAASIASDEADLKKATAIRQKEAATYTAAEAELVEAVDTLGRGSRILQREMAKNPAALAQVDASSLDSLLGPLGTIVDAAGFPTADRQKLLALVQSRQAAEADDDEPGAPAAAVYKTHSSSILDVLEDLKEKAEEQLSDLRKAEASAKHNYAMMKQSLLDDVKADTKDLAEEKASKASSEEAKATAEGDQATTTKELADAKSTLETVKADCAQTAEDHEASTKGREEELKTIAEAKKVLEESTAGAVGQSYSLLQAGRRAGAGSRVQAHADQVGARAVTLVKRLARAHHSAALAQLASRVAAILRFGSSGSADPFGKIKGLISDLISKLEAEADSEATEKVYCDEQTARTEEKKGELEQDMSKLTAKIDQAAAKSAGLKEDVKELQAELAALAKQQAEMDKIRTDGHAAYVEAKEDLEAGLEGVRKALSVLREYYGSGATAAMLQSSGSLRALMRQPAAPTTHKKATGASTGIIGILEVVESDFATNLATEETEEEDAQAEYEKTTQQNKVTKTLKLQDEAYKTQAYKSLDKSLSQLTADRATTDDELSAVLEYYTKIKARCVAKPETYESRVNRRAAEINGLKEALAILEDEAAFVQRRRKGGRAGFLSAGP